MEDARIKAQKDAQGWASVMAGNVYRHFKGGLYVVNGVVVHSETAELLVDTAIAVRQAGIGLCKTARGWLRWAVR